MKHISKLTSWYGKLFDEFCASANLLQTNSAYEANTALLAVNTVDTNIRVETRGEGLVKTSHEQVRNRQSVIMLDNEDYR